ncbi:D-alanyl-D-alanine carboxypeptidase family protein [Halotia branconii]|uniref:D-alanyl-D-alanine carboxypeptidase family protein n=1 Tax=Halotia branconii CENA392 TaxID=1539056 RepID=A0AAJ6NUM0_9CYAN|nr:D-alanyl-D-alanine carboxypeptidase family protein [Halotia branconii]WGV27028.1 D-alanyl-D-alanine carboxypeptidase family protein [Halotia branconii CENA392]
MKVIIKKTKFIAIAIFIIFTVVASNGIEHHKLVTNAQPANECLFPDSLSCIDSSQKPKSSIFIPNPKLSDQERFLSAIASKLKSIPQPDTYEYTLLRVYGAAFVNPESEVKLPSTVIFTNEQETNEFQATLTMQKVDGTNDCYLQKSAAVALNQARSLENIPLKSGYGTGDCTRSFATNLKFWQKYTDNQTLEKVQQGKETAILGVVAPPGTSQHLWGLAIDLRVSSDRQRHALNQNGWFQTVENDIPHWTYIGLSEEYLSQFGFKNKVLRKISYWVTPL